MVSTLHVPIFTAKEKSAKGCILVGGRGAFIVSRSGMAELVMLGLGSCGERRWKMRERRREGGVISVGRAGVDQSDQEWLEKSEKCGREEVEEVEIRRVQVMDTGEI